MAWQVSTEPDTLPFSGQVAAWMERFWRDDNECAVCGQNDWRAEGRVFILQRMMPGEDESGRQVLGTVEGVGRDVFVVVCLHCGHTLIVGAQIAGLRESPIPSDLSGLGG